MEEQIRRLQEEVRDLRVQLSEVRERLGMSQRQADMFVPVPVLSPPPVEGGTCINDDPLSRWLLDSIRAKIQESEDPVIYHSENHPKPVTPPMGNPDVKLAPQKPLLIYDNGSSSKSKASRIEKKRYDPIPMKYSELLPELLKHRLVGLLPAKILQPPYSKSYDPSARCAFHSGMVGHSTDKCFSLRNKVQELIDEKYLVFINGALNAIPNALPQHNGATVNPAESQAENYELTRASAKGISTLQKTVMYPSSSGAMENGKVQGMPATVYYLMK